MENVQIADLESLCFDQEDSRSDPTKSLTWASNYQRINKKSLSNEHRCESGNWETACADSGQWPTASGDGQPGAISQRGAEAERTVCCLEELETSFTRKYEDFNLQQENNPQQSARINNGSLSHSSFDELHDGVPELSMLSENEFTSEALGKSADYGFISAVTCLVTGISLVAISYTVPREVKVNPDSVSAREMERLERENALVGVHLDRWVIAGLCLLTLGGVVLSTLLMVSLWKGEMLRRRAFTYSKQSAQLYGSINLRGGSNSPNVPSQLSVEDLEEVLN
ncbi:transmembrane protein 74 [Oncorhynchus tshawytscha]|uniref:Transmembrane protein 74 n=1 Tax=Oncorhynchus tshawytscha TaxID=74940 RepID=A0AAZ3SCJ1_ONCTS|nr:transmembrane protein 74 [Oncorhynchus tshawytscha]XP_024297658.1 transmembrane protein 74 [Oncorhynchus tshawytscha]